MLLYLYFPPVQRVDAAGEGVDKDLRRLRFRDIEHVRQIILVIISAADAGTLMHHRKYMSGRTKINGRDARSILSGFRFENRRWLGANIASSAT